MSWGLDLLLWDVWSRCDAPQLLQRQVVLDAARNDDGRAAAKALVREVDLLGGVGALELIDRQWVAVDAASTREAKCSSGGKAFIGR